MEWAVLTFTVGFGILVFAYWAHMTLLALLEQVLLNQVQIVEMVQMLTQQLGPKLNMPPAVMSEIEGMGNDLKADTSLAMGIMK